MILFCYCYFCLHTLSLQLIPVYFWRGRTGEVNREEWPQFLLSRTNRVLPPFFWSRCWGWNEAREVRCLLNRGTCLIQIQIMLQHPQSIGSIIYIYIYIVLIAGVNMVMDGCKTECVVVGAGLKLVKGAGLDVGLDA